MRTLRPLAALCFATALSAAADDAVRILARRCVSCHNPDARVSGFDLSSRTALLKGGAKGVDLVPGVPDESRLYRMVASGAMPPDGRLPSGDVDAIRAWIAGGASWGSEASLYSRRARAGLDWWALQPPKKPPVPDVPGAANPIDAFLLAKLAAKGLAFSPPADLRTLTRRVHFDLAGLPPQPEDLKLDYAQTVEKLLASPAYGDRWGRHWLDVVRFGETDGGEHNNERFTAWKYRDYVIEAFNSGKPYNQFIRDQVAGDLIDRSLAPATGFLTAGPWDSVTKEINKDALMARTIRQDELDDMVTATMATFMGLTVNCARCHDHKFDPIPTRDYYRLTAIFHGAGFGERQLATAAEKAARDAAVQPIQKELSRVKADVARIEDPARLSLLQEKYAAFDRERKDRSRRIPVNEIWNYNRFASQSARFFRFAVTSAVGKQVKLARLELLPAGDFVTGWSAAAEAKPDSPVFVNFQFPAPRDVNEIRWFTGAARDGAPRLYRFEASDDGVVWREVCSSMDHIAPVEIDLPEVNDSEVAAALPADLLPRRGELIHERDQWQQRLNAIPPIDSVHAVKPEPMTPAFVLDRGSLTRPGEAVAPGTLTAIRSLDNNLGLSPDAADTDRRLALARWLTDPANPLVARVIVNRVWFWHFGNGIVNTPSDFGYNGDRPSHPELLDWLATELMDHGWDLKWLHRAIVSSRAYQQSSAPNPKGLAVDAGNRLLWRMPLQRMDAETLRDSILFVSGNLNPARGGPGYYLQKKAGGGSYMHKVVDYDGPDVWKRSVYRFVVRGGERIFLDSFDCPDPAVFTPQRSISNTPVQALTLLNNRFVLKQAEMLAARLKPGNEVQEAYQRLFQRAPSDAELAAAQRFIAGNGLALYLRALFNSNEFVYVP